MSGILSRIKAFAQRQTDEPEVPAHATITRKEETTMLEIDTQTPAPNPETAIDIQDIVGDSYELSTIEMSLLKGEVIEKLRSVYDPEIPVNIYDLGLIYDIDVTPHGAVEIQMTLTSPGCPVAGTLPPEVQDKAASIPGVAEARVDLVWEPPWNMDMMTDEAKLELGLY
jgi:FeS assembly SUF system protein